MVLTIGSPLTASLEARASLRSVCCRVWMRSCAAVDKVTKLSHTILHDCWKALIKVYPCGAGTVHTLERYLVASSLIVDGRKATTTPQTSTLSEEYANHLHEIRGFAPSTVSIHRRTTQCFLQHLEEAGNAVKCIRASNIRKKCQVPSRLNPVEAGRHLFVSTGH